MLGPLIVAAAAGFEDLTVFHVNPATYKPTPLNMDTGDAFGDMYFDIRSTSLPLECAHPTNRTSHDCYNAEVVSNDLVVTKLVLGVKPPLGTYGRCNICVNGTDHHGNNSCTNGVYWCSCGDWDKPAPCGKWVGAENISAHFNRTCDPLDHEWDCWKDQTSRKTGGMWYSTTSMGWCGNGSSPPPPGCTWSVRQVVKVVNKTCSDSAIRDSVEAHDAAAGCFGTCEDSGTGPQRNISSPCWIRCFFSTVLGPEAGKPGGALAGMPLPDLLDAWDRPFRPESEGGCPALRPAELEGPAGQAAFARPRPASWRGFGM